ncbi:hypothetical protein ACFOD0_03300 [Shewanella intestini]|uniref:Uncharacterized protein n=1 Tax=Shewanella intestini TaxID=2017544 RepID=A0ABS5I1V9_9GAMM|nr:MULTISPECIES: hypothetical protein [Shewanella]MBR9728021.1 hypothetical protein [Shewanella intestini]MRG36428.1 hypothetical protein [Shewanella sp. XMDDZSB0408]
MSQHDALSVLNTAASAIKSHTSLNSELNDNAGKFSDILSTVSAVSQVGNGMLNANSASDLLGVDALQQKMLADIGLNDDSFFSLAMDDNMVADFQQELLGSLQTSIIQNSIAMTAEQDKAAAQLADADNALDTEQQPSLSQKVYDYAFGEDGLDENDILDSVNILNHTPIISNIYQQATGTQPSPASKLAGSLLYADYIGTGVMASKLATDYLSNSSDEGFINQIGSSLTDNKDKTN